MTIGTLLSTLAPASREESVGTLKFGEACRSALGRSRAVQNTLLDDKTLLRQCVRGEGEGVRARPPSVFARPPARPPAAPRA